MSTSSLVILAAWVFEVSCEKTDRKTDRQTNRQTLKRPEQTTHVTAVSFGKYL